MRRLWTAVLMLLLLCLLAGCGSRSNNDEGEAGLKLRTTLLEANGCTFQADITASDDDYVFTASMDCCYDGKNVAFSITAPEELSGISGTVLGQDLTVTYDETTLTLALSGDVIPVPCGPQLLCQAITSGYISAQGRDGSHDLVQYTVESAGEALEMGLWLDEAGMPAQCQIARDGAVTLVLDIRDFQLS